MDKFIWDGSLETKINQIDCQHKILISIYNDVIEAFNQKPFDDPKVSMAVAAALSELIAYAKYHFYSEEYMMELAHYPGLSAHKLEHDALRERLAYYHTKHVILGEMIDEGIVSFFCEWVVGHIGKSDSQYVALVRSKLPLGEFCLG